MHGEGHFSKSESKIDVFERLARPAVPGEKVLSLPKYDDSIPDLPFTFYAKKGQISALIKKGTMCNKGEIDFFRLR